MPDIRKYCEYLYNSLSIPVYLYEHKVLAACYPQQEKDTLPALHYLSSLWKTDKEVTYVITQFYSYYGCIRITGKNTCIVIGPVSPMPYTKDILLMMRKEFCNEDSKSEPFNRFFHNISTYNLDAFFNTLLFINYTVNDSELTRSDIAFDVDSLRYLYQSINKKYHESSYASKEERILKEGVLKEGILNNNYEVERKLFQYVETGNVKGLENLFNQANSMKTGVIADNNLRQAKNTFIVAVTLAVRAAIKGGLTPSVAYLLSDTYIQQVERLTDMDAIYSLLQYVIYDYTNRTANSLIPPNTDNMIHKVIKYVRENVNANITVADVAEYVNFNRSYLSRKFKKELGFDLSKFILRCKLEEAKDLLAYSDKSISEISNFLCFSSQSHFQKAFKNQFDITPQNYRRSVS